MNSIRPLGVRLKRAAKELLAMPQWALIEAPRATSYEEQLYLGLVREGDVCFDVGANVGAVALFLAKVSGPRGTIVSFEPLWSMHPQIAATVQRDSQHSKAPVVTVPAALSNAPGSSTIQIPAETSQLASIAGADAWGEAQPGANIRSQPITLITLDEFLYSSGLPDPAFLKIDVEGAEWLVLQGASRTIERVRPLMVIEVFAPWERAFGYGPYTPLSWLVERGYNLLFVSPQGLVAHTPTPTAPFPPQYELGYNVIAYQPTLHNARVDALEDLRYPSSQVLAMTPPPRPNRIE
jgi:FkbM family methyltransferase